MPRRIADAVRVKVGSRSLVVVIALTSAVGVYRLWRDGGYAFGALLAGLVADALGVPSAIAVVGALTFLSGVVVLVRMYETLPGHGALKPAAWAATRSQSTSMGTPAGELSK